MTVTITRIGRRSYIQAPYAAKDILRNAGCHWDAAQKSWWTGSQAEAERLAAKIAAREPSSAEDEKAMMLARDCEHIIGRAQYQGHAYYLVGEGVRADGSAWMRLLFRDGSRTFFAAAGEAQVTRYQSTRTLTDLREYAAAKAAAQSGDGRSPLCTTPTECLSALSWDAPDRLCRHCAALH